MMGVTFSRLRKMSRNSECAVLYLTSGKGMSFPYTNAFDGG